MSITDTRKQRKAARRTQQALKKNPYDTEALLQLAYSLGSSDKPDLSQKRQVLHRILYLEPANQQARQMLFELDRATIGGNRARLSAAIILPDPSSNELPERTLILRYSLVHQLLVYLFIAGTVFAGLSLARDAEGWAVVGALLLFLLIPLWFVSVVIELSSTGLKISRLFGLACWNVSWREIRECMPTLFGQGIRVIASTGKVAEVSAQVNGYAFILDILHQMRPDLFRGTDVARIGEKLQKDVPVSSTILQTFERIVSERSPGANV